jgi:hypothetical protein
LLLLEEYAGAMPEMLAPEERHRVYKIMRLSVTLSLSGDLEMSGDVMPRAATLCRPETPYPPGSHLQKPPSSYASALRSRTLREGTNTRAWSYWRLDSSFEATAPLALRIVKRFHVDQR